MIVEGIRCDSGSFPCNVHIAVEIPDTAIYLAVIYTGWSPAGSCITVGITAVHIAGAAFVRIRGIVFTHCKVAVQCELGCFSFATSELTSKNTGCTIAGNGSIGSA